MAFLDDLQKSAGMLEQTLTQIAATRAVADANDQAQMIKATVTDELEQRRAMNDLSMNLSRNLMASGVSAEQAAQAGSFFQPQAIASPEAAFLQGRPKLAEELSQFRAMEETGKLGRATQAKFSEMGQEQLHKKELFDKQAALQRELAVIRSKGGEAAQTAKEDDKYLRRKTEFAKQVINPQARSRFGRYQNLIDSADAALILARSAGMSEGQLAPENETRTQAIERLNNMDVRQAEEMIRSLDRMLSQSVPTVSGQEHLRADTYISSLQKFKEKLLNERQPAKLGSFIYQFVDTLNRERQGFRKRQGDAVKVYSQAYKDIEERDPEFFKAVLMQGDEDSSNSFPKTLSKKEGGRIKKVKVSNPAELKEAQSEGFN